MQQRFSSILSVIIVSLGSKQGYRADLLFLRLFYVWPWWALEDDSLLQKHPLALLPAASLARPAASSAWPLGLLSEWPKHTNKHTERCKRMNLSSTLKCIQWTMFFCEAFPSLTLLFHTMCQVSWMMPTFSDRISMSLCASPSLNTMLLMVDTRAL